jgi:anti-sigma regulatory factor (Ser/Thr protein kinase)
VVTELVSNAVGHARCKLTVCLRAEGEALLIEVTDDGPGWPVLRVAASHDVAGRGLFLVDKLADAWGVRPTRDPPGKTVWAQVQLAL